LAWQLEWLSDAHCAAHVSSHCAWQKEVHWLGLMAAMQRLSQFPLQCALQVLLQSATANA
jgi:hypothetical protein